MIIMKKKQKEKRSIIAVEGSEHELGWILLMAFRYGVGRHFTQALLDVQKTIVNNFDLLCDDFIRQMINDIDTERRSYELRKEKGDKIPFDLNVDYLDSFYNELVKEYEARKSAGKKTV